MTRRDVLTLLRELFLDASVGITEELADGYYSGRLVIDLEVVLDRIDKKLKESPCPPTKRVIRRRKR